MNDSTFFSDIPIEFLFIFLALLIIISGFFSGSETGLMSLNRYRLRHLCNKKHNGAIKAAHLLKTPDKLIGVILLGNNFVNILAAAIVTVIGSRLYGDTGVMIATAVLTLVILIFSEVTPKTLAAMYPERFAFPASFLLTPLLRLFYPFVWIINQASRLIFRLFGISSKRIADVKLSAEELRIVLNEAGTVIPQRHQQMLLNLLDLEKVTVDDIMVPRQEIIGIDLEDDWDTIAKQIIDSQHTRLPVFKGDINTASGFLHLRKSIRLFDKPETMNKESLKLVIRDAYFVPEGTPLNVQLQNFQREKHRTALVVDEYGDIQGLITLEDLLEEVVGEFTSDPAALSKDIRQQDDGSYLVDGSTSIRELNRALGWKLPIDGPKTLNGLILEYLEHIPAAGTSLMLENHPMDVVQISNNAVKTVLVTTTELAEVEPGEDID